MKRTPLKRKTPLRRKGKSPISRVKDRIQSVCRSIVIARDGGCILRNVEGVPECSGWNSKEELVLQADHLITRAKNISYADIKLIVCVCRGHHLWKKWNKEKYDAIVKTLLPKSRVTHWEKTQANLGVFQMSLLEWERVEVKLIKELEKYETY